MSLSLKRRYILSFIGLAIAFAIYGYGFSRSPAMNPNYRTQQEMLASYAKGQGNAAEIRMLAEAYWQRNPDVAMDSYFGRDGKLGLFGAREHFDRHGRAEGRRWGQ